MRITASGRYECKVCFQTFRRTGGLKQHMLSHAKTFEHRKTIRKAHGNRPLLISNCDGVDSPPKAEAALSNVDDKADVCLQAYGRRESNANHSTEGLNCSRDSLANVKPNPGPQSLGSGRYECGICLLTFSRSGGLKQHKRCHESEDEFCTKKTTNSQASQLSRSFLELGQQLLQEQLQNEPLPTMVHRMKGDDFILQPPLLAPQFNFKVLSGRFECKLCFKTYSKKDGLRQHMVFHSGLKPYKCGICDKSFGRKYSFDIHTRIHMNQRHYRCEICDKAFVTKGKLAIHIRIHTKERPYACDVCSKKFIQRDHLTSHRLTHMKDSKKYKCLICSAAFTRKSSVSVHMQGCHSSLRSFGCQLCGKSFKTSPHLSIHMKSHLVEKPHSCEYCPKRFAQKGTLATHTRRHRQEKLYGCAVCRKRFVAKNDLDKHLRIHYNIKPYSCELCYKAFAQVGNYKRHMMHHTGEKPFSCEVCRTDFRQKAHLNKHMRVHAASANISPANTLSHAPDVSNSPQVSEELIRLATNVVNGAERPDQMQVETCDGNTIFNPNTPQGSTEVPELDEEWKIKEEYFDKCYPEDASGV